MFRKPQQQDIPVVERPEYEFRFPEDPFGLGCRAEYHRSYAPELIERLLVGLGLLWQERRPGDRRDPSFPCQDVHRQDGWITTQYRLHRAVPRHFDAAICLCVLLGV